MDLYFKTALVFSHFAIAAFCLVTIIRTDLKLLKHYGLPASAVLCDEIEQVKRAVTWGLIGLWITGLIIVGYGLAKSPTYLDNPKLLFKIAVVVALTLNGLLVHRAGRVLRPGVRLAALDDHSALLLNLAGTTSSISWLWACLLGTARAWNGTLSFETISVYYVTSLLVGLTVAIALHVRQRRVLSSMVEDWAVDETYELAGEDVVPVHSGVARSDTAVH